MARTTADQFVNKWSQNTKGAVQYYKDGIMQTSINPMEAAANAADKYAAGVQEAVSTGRFQAGLRAVSKSDWQKAASEKGAQRIASGVDGAKSKMQRIAGPLLAAVDSAAAQAHALPSATFEDRINRMVAFSRSMHNTQIKG